MCKCRIKIAVFCLICCVQIALSAEEDTRSEAAIVKIAQTENPPNIDGILSEGEWTKLMGTLSGLDGIETKRTLELIPTVTLCSTGTREPGALLRTVSV